MPRLDFSADATRLSAILNGISIACAPFMVAALVFAAFLTGGR